MDAVLACGGQKAVTKPKEWMALVLDTLNARLRTCLVWLVAMRGQ